ncbi:RPII140-upstream gene protein [Galleria mellonella]|uniref:Complex I assembly factor TIMMDC1, mitochondrial n=1 Tax=Galleria mellonella TaxID=7137 RepID=A0ABM3MM95_GALME|nr:RPII140-upstream gene protein [Galleria mellonella]XP_052752369.1 RPII140-upstream gene protein [Galleria mellonella]
MLRTVVRLTPTLILPFFDRKNENDYNMLDLPVPAVPQTGWERVKKMYRKNEFDEISPELHTVAQASLCGAFVGACMGGFTSSRQAYVYFIENNQATIFKSTMQAKKKLQDYVTVAFAKGAYHWGWRLGIFTGIFSLVATTVSVYRNDTSVLEYVMAGAISGGLYKVNLGLAATFVGAGLGSILGLVAGSVIAILLKLTGITMDDIRKSLHKIKEAREDQYNQALEKSAKIKNDDLTRYHQALIEEKGPLKIEELN